MLAPGDQNRLASGAFPKITRGLACVLVRSNAAMRGDLGFLITRDEIHGLFAGVLNDTDRDAVTFAARVDGAIARLAGLEILRKNRDDEDSYLISPVITAIMTASVITELQQQFEQLLNGGAPAEEDVDLD